MGHAILGITGLVLAIEVLITGAMTTGRIKRLEGTNSFKLHRKVSILFGLFMLGTFFYGLWIVSQHGEPILTSVHGWLGLIISIITIVQIIPCLAVKERRKIRIPHMVLGYAAAVLVVIQTALGIEIAVVETLENLVLLHSTFGGIAALAATWILVEMRHLTEKGIFRAKLASYVTAAFNIVGCWIIGGYYYLTVYGSQVKPEIIAGPQPWAHQIIMETKEHIFLFLPVISLALMMTMILLSQDDTLLKNSKSRRAVTAISYLILFMILLTFVMGAIISNAARIGVEGE